MRKSVWLLAFLAGALILAVGDAAAENEGARPIVNTVLGADHPTGIVEFARKNVVGDGPAPPMPVPIEPTQLLGRDTLTGPVIMSDGDLSEGMGGVVVAPRGAAFSSPRQLADREIRKLIRRLD